MPKISEESIKKIIDSADIVELVSQYIPLQKNGASYKAICPFHKEKSSSFFVNPIRKMFHCFGCGVGGGIFKFLMLYEQIDFPSAVRKLAEHYGIILETEESVIALKNQSLKDRSLYIHQKVADWYQSLLNEHPISKVARDYLKDRKITQKSIECWNIGYAPFSSLLFLNWAKDNGFSEEELVKSGLWYKTDYKQGYSRFRERIIFPIKNDYGNIIAFSGRIFSDKSKQEGKYINSPETILFSKSRVLFGLSQNKKSIVNENQIVIVEGPLDVISLSQHGFSSVVAPQGTALSLDHGLLIKRFTSRIILCFDGDHSGKVATEKAVSILLPLGMDISCVDLPNGEDPDSFILKHGKDNFMTLLEEATDFFRYTIRNRYQRIDNINPHQKLELAHYFVAFLEKINDCLLFNEYFNFIVNCLNISPSILAQYIHKKNDHKTSTFNHQRQQTILSPASQDILRLSLICQEVREWLMEHNYSEYIESDINNELRFLKPWILSISHLDSQELSLILEKLPSDIQNVASEFNFDVQFHSSTTPLQRIQKTFFDLYSCSIKARERKCIKKLEMAQLSIEEIKKIQQEMLDIHYNILSYDDFLKTYLCHKQN